jgi:hypothetical protein
MKEFEIWKRGKAYEVIFREGEGLSVLSVSGSLSQAKKRLAYHKKRKETGYLLREDPSVWTDKTSRKAKLMRVI